MDRMSPEDRHKTMAAVKNRDTDIEMLLRRALWSRGHRYRVSTNLIGHPDIVFPSKRLVVFCDGCFWHGCPRCNQRPETNEQFWSSKIATNRARDQQVTKALTDAGWKVLRYWGCEIRRNLDGVVSDIEAHLRGQK